MSDRGSDRIHALMFAADMILFSRRHPAGEQDLPQLRLCWEMRMNVHHALTLLQLAIASRFPSAYTEMFPSLFGKRWSTQPLMIIHQSAPLQTRIGVDFLRGLREIAPRGSNIRYAHQGSDVLIQLYPFAYDLHRSENRLSAIWSTIESALRGVQSLETLAARYLRLQAMQRAMQRRNRRA